MAIQGFLVTVVGSLLIGFASAANKSCECKPAVTFGKNYTVSVKTEQFFSTFSFVIDQSNVCITLLGSEKNVSAGDKKSIDDCIASLQAFIKIEGTEIDSEIELNDLVEKLTVEFKALVTECQNLTKLHLSEETISEIELLVSYFTYYSGKIGDMAECSCAKKKKS